MLTANYNGKRVFIGDYVNPKADLKKESLACPFCEHGLIIKHGMIISPHFAHKPDSNCNYERLQGEPESEKHRALKLHAAEVYRKRFPKATVSFESRCCEGKRIADVFVTYPTGQAMVIECQVSRIALMEIQARNRDYEREGLEVYWFFNKDLLTPTFMTELAEILPEFHEVTFDES